MVEVQDFSIPDLVTVEFRWGTETFFRTEDRTHGRYIYRSRGTLDGKGGLRLQYQMSKSEIDERDDSGWEICGSQGKCLYRLQTDAASPGDFLGSQTWARGDRSSITLVVMQKARADIEPGGWIEGGLLAFDRRW
ncbi:unnamed protein product [Cladocopium goreaui]|uniref:Uncharacterized protein n=1 Tax=Cladocopium goreaui TaxID=2562237 RepID=A0A9P1GGU3_9DINO|nr:unnamed protein product [Cladocopium goreaui]|mmetsp:Transcript_9730/g.21695  ORF Transcript_9730/g.21695 Transcript_9730/m.21695 type:complete len:135 (+) Transcript_9730:52-456(+)